ncbi:MAG TPA: ribosome silencing factor [Pirellulales bacterium]|jgi:ribosome-associated protein|nr:ribosome silencing factor [Pirellulales bacterium]
MELLHRSFSQGNYHTIAVAEESLAITAASLTAAKERPQRSLQVALVAAQVAHDNRGQSIVLLDLREMTAVFDFFLLVTGSSRRQLHAVADEIEHTLAEKYGEKLIGMEGYAAGTWILQDYGDVVIHLFDEKAREYYSLEQLWTGAKRIDWQPASAPRIAQLE